MIIELNKKEIESALIEHINRLFPGKWTITGSYGRLDSMEFTKLEKSETEEEIQIMESINY